MLGVICALFVADYLHVPACVVHRGIDTYWYVVYAAQRFNGFYAVLALYGIGLRYGSQEYGLIVQPLLFGEGRVLCVSQTLAMLDSCQVV